MRQRIDHLENLVKNLVAQRQGASSPGGHEDETTAPLNSGAGPVLVPGDVAGTGRTLIDGVRSMYLSGDEWQVVLQEVLYCCNSALPGIFAFFFFSSSEPLYFPAAIHSLPYHRCLALLPQGCLPLLLLSRSGRP
jgi:hypothetical protein